MGRLARRVNAKAHEGEGRDDLHYVTAPLDELTRRISIRNETAPPGAVVNLDDLKQWSEIFEAPTTDELED